MSEYNWRELKKEEQGIHIISMIYKGSLNCCYYFLQYLKIKMRQSKIMEECNVYITVSVMRME